VPTTLPAAPAASKPAPSAERRTKPDSGPEKERDEARQIYDALCDSAFMRDSAAILKGTQDLLERVEDFLDEHSSTELAIAVRKAVGGGVNDHFIELAVNLIDDVEMLKFNLRAAVSFVESQVYQRPASRSKSPRRSR
jgi:hypothetical protein